MEETQPVVTWRRLPIETLHRVWPQSLQQMRVPVLHRPPVSSGSELVDSVQPRAGFD
jgi:hypothetical protein